MGADLAIAWAPASTAPHDEIHRRIDTLSDTILADVLAEWSGYLVSPETEAEINEDLGGSWEEVTRGRLREAAATVLGGNSRSIVLVTHKGASLWIGGGTSWGDSPEGYDDVLLLAIAGVLDDERW